MESVQPREQSRRGLWAGGTLGGCWVTRHLSCTAQVLPVTHAARHPHCLGEALAQGKAGGGQAAREGGVWGIAPWGRDK